LIEKIKSQTNVRFSPFEPMTHLIITDKFSFVELYHKGGDIEIRNYLNKKQNIPYVDCWGGFVPCFMVENSSFFAILMKSHFNNIWGSSDVEKRDLRNNDWYSAIKIYKSK
jgi:hypothetical protein